MCLGIFCRRYRSVRIFLVAGRYRVFTFRRLFSACRILDGIALCDCCVDYFACQDICLGHDVAGLEFFALADSEFLDDLVEPCQFVIHFHVGVRYVSVVRHRDRVLDLFAELERFAVCRTVADFLVYCQGRVQRFCRLFFCAAARFRIFVSGSVACGCRLVHDFALQDIFFGHFVTRCEFCALSGGKTCDRLVKTGQLIFHNYVCERQITVVRDCDLVTDRLAKCVCLTVLRCRCRFFLDCQL